MLLTLMALAASLMAIGFGLYRKLNTGLAMAVGGLVLFVAGRMPPQQLGEALLAVVTDRTTINLAVSVLLLGTLGHVMKQTGALSQTVAALKELTGQGKTTVVAVPMLVSMLAVPGGAILSAPMVDEGGRQLGLSPTRLSALNVFYRHIIYYLFPLFPSLLLACELAGLSTYTMARYNFPAVLIGGAAAIPLLRPAPRISPDSEGTKSAQRTASLDATAEPAAPQHHPTTTGRWDSLLRLVSSCLPVLVIIVGALGLRWPYPVTIGLAVLIALAGPVPQGENRAVVFWRRCRGLTRGGVNWASVFTVLGIMFYKEVLGRQGSVDYLASMLLDAGIPLPVVLATVPFAVSFLTGDNAAAVGITFPLFLPLLDGGASYARIVAALYAGSTGGHILSPAHPCVALSNDFFRVPYGSVARLIAPATLVATAVGCLNFFVPW